MLSTDIQKLLKDFVVYLQSIPLTNNPNKDKLELIIKELRQLSKMKPIINKVAHIKYRLQILSTLAKHPNTQKNIKIMLDVIKSKKRPNVFTGDILSIVNSFMTYDEILQKCRTDRTFAQACNNNYLWYMLIQRDFPWIKVDQTDPNLRDIYKQWVVKYKQTRRELYNTIKALKLQWRSKQYTYEFTMFFPAEAMTYFESISNLPRFGPSVIAYVDTQGNKRGEYLLLKHNLFYEYHDKDKSVIPFVQGTLDAYKQHKPDIDDFMYEITDKILEKKIPYYIVTETSEKLVYLPYDILSAYAYIRTISDATKGDQTMYRGINGSVLIVQRKFDKIVQSLKNKNQT